ncbi:DUF2637 domain-containing protein [Streptomyces sp. YS-3]|uniref:DUF2637 domain-containing protein n=1 Tax=Streptomyces sp. YS-3 TaxID=3381352 RepID=UPI00386222B3
MLLVAAGVVGIAGIGFAGSYAAVRALAERKGFGAFSLVFPVGIDAGICVLLALDLLLTWIRIPFPLLRQTAWLLTAATIAFNGAAAWPDPLGVGMHAVIPVLFVVAVEAARHAVGRIADITADKHMEGVRYARWLLSPVPTFRLWRRMKLWELRSYEQVIKLEQDRLVYRARLKARYGRAWRRKAPVESLMPLRLARFGVPLAETGPAGLAAAGIEPTLLPRVPPVMAEAGPEPAERLGLGHEPDPAGEKGHVPASAGGPAALGWPVAAGRGQRRAGTSPQERRLADAYRDWMDAFAVEPTGAQFAIWLQEHYRLATAGGQPLAEAQVEPLLRLLRQLHTATLEHGTEPLAAPGVEGGRDDRSSSAGPGLARGRGGGPEEVTEATVVERGGRTACDAGPAASEGRHGHVGVVRRPGGRQNSPFAVVEAVPGVARARAWGEPHAGKEAASAGAGVRPVGNRPRVRVSAAVEVPGRDGAAVKSAPLSVVDRYYLAWRQYQDAHGAEPAAAQLSVCLAGEWAMTGRGGKPLSPSTLRRYLVAFRIYTVWARHRACTPDPSLDVMVQECTDLGITGQYNRPVTAAYLVQHVGGFERRWHVMKELPAPSER